LEDKPEDRPRLRERDMEGNFSVPRTSDHEKGKWQKASTRDGEDRRERDSGGKNVRYIVINAQERIATGMTMETDEKSEEEESERVRTKGPDEPRGREARSSHRRKTPKQLHSARRVKHGERGPQ